MGVHNPPPAGQSTRTGVYRSFWIDAAAMFPDDGDGATAAQIFTTTNGIGYDVFDFSGTGSDRNAVWFKFATPHNIDTDSTKISFKVHWEPATGASASDTCNWGVRYLARANDEAIDAALDAVTSVTDTVTAVGDLHVTEDIQKSVTTADHEMLFFQLLRNASLDNMAENGRLLGVEVQYLESSTEPSIFT